MNLGSINIEGIIGDVTQMEDFQNNKVQTTFLDVVRQVESQKNASGFLITINSPGGLVDEGDQIFDYLNNLQVPLTTFAQNVCASMATKIFMVGQERIIDSNCEFMIHNPWGSKTGDANTLAAYASELKKLEKAFIDFYSTTTGTSKEAIAPLMSKETVLKPEQAVELGFATEIYQNDLKAVALLNPKNMSTKNITKEDLDNKFDSFWNKIQKIIKGDKPKALVIQDVNGAEIDFPDVEEGQTPAEGDTATVDGSPAQGEYTLPNGTMYTFEGGALTAIQDGEVEEDEELAQLREQNQTLQQQLDEATAALNTSNEQREALMSSVNDMKDELTELKNLAGTFALDGKKKRHNQVGGSNEPKKRTL